jgi:hypothetical protein
MKHSIVQCIEIGITVGGNDETVLFLTNTLYIHISPHIYMRFNFIIALHNTVFHTFALSSITIFLLINIENVEIYFIESLEQRSRRILFMYLGLISWWCICQ